MARRARRDEPGAWHHVYNRAISKRDPALKPLQETVRQADVEFFDTIFRLN